MGRKTLDEVLSEEQEDTTAEIRQSLPEEKGVEAEEKPVEAEPEQKAEEPAPEEPPSSDKLPEDVYKPLKAVRDENKTLKERLEEQGRYLEELRRESEARQQEPEQPKDIWEDTQGWQQQFGGQVVNQAVQAASYQNKLSTSEFYARKNIDGFEDSWGDLNKWLKENPAVAEQAAGDYDPWGFAYRQFNNQRKLAEVGDLETYEKQLREKWEAEYAAQQPAQPGIPPSLSTQRSVSSRSGPAWGGPKDLNSLLK